jgi:hypothetical protein
MFARFSTVTGERGAVDAERDIRGFALKFYTEQGNRDIVGNNTTPRCFSSAARCGFPTSITRSSATRAPGLRSADNNWDFWTLLPEALHQVTIVMSDHGIPKSFGHVAPAESAIPTLEPASRHADQDARQHIKARWICEQAHQQLKEEPRLDHFEGRYWSGLHRHALMTMIAYAFLQNRRLAGKKGSPDRHHSQAYQRCVMPSSLTSSVIAPAMPALPEMVSLRAASILPKRC